MKTDNTDQAARALEAATAAIEKIWDGDEGFTPRDFAQAALATLPPADAGLVEQARNHLAKVYEVFYRQNERFKDGSDLQIEANQMADETFLLMEDIDTALSGQEGAGGGEARYEDDGRCEHGARVACHLCDLRPEPAADDGLTDEEAATVDFISNALRDNGHG